MDLKNAQKQVDDWISQYVEGYWKPHEIMVRLLEESGELAREVNHRFGPKKKKSTSIRLPSRPGKPMLTANIPLRTRMGAPNATRSNAKIGLSAPLGFAHSS